MSRIVSAAVLLLLVVGTLWVLPPWATAVLAAITAAFAGHELARIADAAGARVPAVFVAVASAALVPAFLFSTGDTGLAGDLGAVILALVVASGTLVLALGPPSTATLTQVSAMTFAPIYAGVPLGVLAWVQWSFGPAATSWLLATIAVSDTAQYYTGRAFGRAKLAPLVSPSKTRAGAVGGFLIAAIAGAAIAPWCLPFASTAEAAVLAAILSIAGMVGDLFESALKRSVGLKDSSLLIPGHGGILDRIDSHLFAAPVFYLFVRYYA
jgi:phosphatidate cytidylyltransferase